MTSPFADTRLLVVGAHTTATQFLLKRLPETGEYLVADGYRVAADGGRGSNQAVAAARIGARVTLVSAVGDDDAGHAALAYLGGQGIDLRHVRVTRDLPTGIGAGFYADGGSLVGATFLGANAEITAAYLDAHQALFAEGYDAMLVSLELPIDGVLRALALGRAAGIRPIVVNPAPADSLPRALLPAIDVLTPNESEARLLTGADLATDDPIERVAANVASSLGAPLVVVTLGKNGCYLFGTGLGRQLACPEVVAVDASGAGDCFSACLTAALGAHWSIDDAAALALNAASLSVTRRDTWTAYPTYDEVRDMFGGS
jgi:ribokinase